MLRSNNVQVKQSKSSRLHVANAVGWDAWNAHATIRGAEVQLCVLQNDEIEAVRLEAKAYVRSMETDIRSRLQQNNIVRFWQYMLWFSWQYIFHGLDITCQHTQSRLVQAYFLCCQATSWCAVCQHLGSHF
jgi:hypothetical protein